MTAQNQPDYFTNRKDEIRLFDLAVHGLSMKRPTPVLMYYGVGGIGKTKLIEHLKQRSTNPYVASVALDFGQATNAPVAVDIALPSLIRQLLAIFPRIGYSRFLPLWNRYRELTNKNPTIGIMEASRLLQGQMALAVTDVATHAFFDYKSGDSLRLILLKGLFNSAPHVKESLQNWSLQKIYDVLLPEATAWFKQQFKTEEWWETIQEADEVKIEPLLAAAFSADVRQFLEREGNVQQLILFLDRYEVIQNLDDKFVRGLLQHRTRGETDTLIVVISGRHPLDTGLKPLTKWSRLGFSVADLKREQEIKDLPTPDILNIKIGNFSLAYVEDYLRQRFGAVDKVLAEKVHKLTRGYPLYVILAAEIVAEQRAQGYAIDSNLFNKYVHQVDAPLGEEYEEQVGGILLDRFLSEVGKHARVRDTIFDSAVLRRFSLSMLQALRLGIGVDGWEKVVGYSFVEKEQNTRSTGAAREDFFTYHQVLRSAILNKLVDEQPTYLEAIHKRCRDYFQETHDPEQLYHQFAIKINTKDTIDPWRILLLESIDKADRVKQVWLVQLAQDVLDDGLIELAHHDGRQQNAQQQIDNARHRLKWEIELFRTLEEEQRIERIKLLESLANKIRPSAGAMPFLFLRCLSDLGDAYCDIDEHIKAGGRLDEAIALLQTHSTDAGRLLWQRTSEDVYIRRARVHQLVGEYEVAIPLFEAAIKRLRNNPQAESTTELLRRKVETELLRHLGSTYGSNGQYDKEVEKLQEALRLIESADQEEHFQFEETEIHKQLAEARLTKQGLLSLANKHAKRSETIAEKIRKVHGRRKPLAQIMDTQGRIRRAEQHYPEAIAAHQECIQIKTDHKDDGGVAWALGDQGFAYLLHGDRIAAEQCCKQAMELRPKEKGDLYGTVRARIVQALVYSWSGDPLSARLLLEEVSRYANVKEHILEITLQKIELGLRYQEQVMVDEDEIHKALNLVKELKLPSKAARYCLLRGLYSMLQQHDYAVAVSWITAAVKAIQHFYQPHDLACYRAFSQYTLHRFLDAAPDRVATIKDLQKRFQSAPKLVETLQAIALPENATSPAPFWWPGYYF